MSEPDLSHLAQPGARLTVKAVPRSKRAGIDPGTDPIRVRVTAAPEKGRANAAVARLLAKALGIAPGRLRLVQGQSHRIKVFEIQAE
ncbi:DUF167 domain-containing protein [Dinoroseobacter sp. S375]|uniref:DUF167 domain-containing protein n=1 Tax=Dinoroseobacter sp. S375 TaxID=3415136 RepID=UPI003C7D0BB6